MRFRRTARAPARLRGARRRAGAQLPPPLLGLRRRSGPARPPSGGCANLSLGLGGEGVEGDWARSAIPSRCRRSQTVSASSPADEIVLVTHTEDEEHWVEHDLVEQVRTGFPGFPIVHLVAGARRLVPAA